MKKILIKYKFEVLLLITFFVALALRTYNLSSLPSSLMEDEVLSGYVGRFILQNGVDLYGNAWPLLYFDKFGDFYIIGPMYLNGLSTFIFGVTAFAVRFPTALIGSMIVLPLYYLVFRLFNNKVIGIISTILISISPWHIILSRSTAEGVIGTTLFLSGIALLIRYLKKRSYLMLTGATLLFIVCYFIYHPFRLYTPLVILVAAIIFYKKTTRSLLRSTIPMISVFTIFISITIYISSTSWGSGRLTQISIFSPLARVESAQQEQIYNLNEGSVLQARLFHNKYLAYTREFVTQYLSYFSTSYLFTQGDVESRYDVPQQGLLYIGFLVLIISSFLPIKSGLRVNGRILVFVIFLALLAPVPSSFTYFGSPNIHRSIFLLPFLMVPIAYGAFKLTQHRIGRFFLSGIVLVTFLEMIVFWHQYSTQSDAYTAIRRNDGQKELVQYLEKAKDSYDKIILPREGTMSLYTLFYTQNFDRSLADQFGKDVQLESFGKYRFVEQSCPTINMDIKDSNVLVVSKYHCIEPNPLAFEEVARIRGKNELMGFVVYKSL